LKAYNYRCTVTGKTCIEVLQAVHIQPYINEQSNHVQNGICLRVDIHKLFDEGLISIDDDYRIITSPIINNSFYKNLNGIKINLPEDVHRYPSLKALEHHRKTLFRGIFIK
jgi:putative restriction endonuclease